jgi:hypothetical protein
MVPVVLALAKRVVVCLHISPTTWQWADFPTFTTTLVATLMVVAYFVVPVMAYQIPSLHRLETINPRVLPMVSS